MKLPLKITGVECSSQTAWKLNPILLGYIDFKAFVASRLLDPVQNAWLLPLFFYDVPIHLISFPKDFSFVPTKFHYFIFNLFLNYQDNFEWFFYLLLSVSSLNLSTHSIYLVFQAINILKCRGLRIESWSVTFAFSTLTEYLSILVMTFEPTRLFRNVMKYFAKHLVEVKIYYDHNIPVVY